MPFVRRVLVPLAAAGGLIAAGAGGASAAEAHSSDGTCDVTGKATYTYNGVQHTYVAEPGPAGCQWVEQPPGAPQPPLDPQQEAAARAFAAQMAQQALGYAGAPAPSSPAQAG
ncbi:hypothetical protein [Pseudonocardia sp. N23]|uniref:hypothetical protein n=1 Tax=Pseudonocardia sp. N23 TaxID=1987376 RepID=UPI000BFCA1D6|nr:hypothetical protein [Pseudonocardia sp. N23]GAY09171.1 hypothetical protein TOK_3128 [Pseudonocardia sp. N23]